MNSRIHKYIALIFLFMLVTSCGEKKKEDLIPEKAFIAILTDSYLADGVLSIPAIRDKYSKRDSIENYIDIFKAHGYTNEEMQKTLDYYFTHEPKRLSQIFDEMKNSLSVLESEASVQQQILLNAENEKLRMKYHFILPDSSVKEKPGFSYDLNISGTYRLIFSVTIWPTDQSHDPCFTAWIAPTDTASGGKITWLPVIKYIKDGRPHIYTVTGKIEMIAKSVLRGVYFDYSNNPAWCDLYADIHNLSFNLVGGPQ